MVRKWIVGVILVVAAVIGLGYLRPSPRSRILDRAGPVDADAPKDFTTTESGLKYRILRRGEGEKPSAEDTVVVNYAGWLDNGRQFDSSYDRDPARFPLNEVVPGWTEGLQYVSEGGMIELEIPSELGYGPQGRGSAIPPDSTLHFIVELVDVTEPVEPAVPGPSDPDAPQEFTTTDTGLKYRILRKGSGPQPLPTDEVQVHYKGSLDDGTLFDSTYERGSPVGSALETVPIPGLVEGLQYVREGGMIELEIPGELGYGPEGVPPRIPPNATLHFTVELLKVHREGAEISP